MLKLFIDHPATVGETYWAHLLFAGRFGLRMMAGGAACLLHGLLPFLFTTTGSRTILALQAQMRHRRQGKASERFALSKIQQWGPEAITRTVRCNASRDNKISLDVLRVVAGTSLDTGASLDKIARLPVNSSAHEKAHSGA